MIFLFSSWLIVEMPNPNQEEPEDVDKINKNKVPSNALKGLGRQARSMAQSSIEQSYLGTFIIHMVCMLVQGNLITNNMFDPFNKQE